MAGEGDGPGQARRRPGAPRGRRRLHRGRAGRGDPVHARGRRAHRAAHRDAPVHALRLPHVLPGARARLRRARPLTPDPIHRFAASPNRCVQAEAASCRSESPRGRAGRLGDMSMSSGLPRNVRSPLRLEFPHSLAVYDDYEAAQKAVDFLSDHEFPVEHCMIVGTDLKRIERITGRLTTSRVALGGLVSGVWLGLFVGLIFAIFTNESALATILSTMLIGAVFGVVWALVGYAATRGQRDFSSVTSV